MLLTGLLTGVNAQTPAPPVAAEEIAEDKLFFREFRRAARFLDQGARDEAALFMQLLHNQLSTSPWMEISLLKLSELLETRNDEQAMDGYLVLRQRVINSPYFQRGDERIGMFGTAIDGAAERGIQRIRLRRIRWALEKYFIRFQQYPENLAKLAIFDLVAPEDILDANDRPFRYLPTGQQFRPQIRYLRYELERIPREPFAPNAPRLDSTTLIQEDPPVYAARISLPGRVEPVEIRKYQTIDGYFVIVIAEDGIVLCTAERVVVIPTQS